MHQWAFAEHENDFMEKSKNMFSIVIKEQAALMDPGGLIFLLFHRSDSGWSASAVWLMCTVDIILSSFSADRELPFHVSALSYTWTHVFFSADSMRSMICPRLLPPRPNPPQEMDFLAPAKLWIGCDLCYSQHEASSTGPPSLLLHQPFSWKERAEGRKPFKGTIVEVNKRDPAGEAGWGESQQ